MTLLYLFAVQCLEKGLKLGGKVPRKTLLRVGCIAQNPEALVIMVVTVLEVGIMRVIELYIGYYGQKK